jgi:hypothetical protein
MTLPRASVLALLPLLFAAACSGSDAKGDDTGLDDTDTTDTTGDDDDDDVPTVGGSTTPTTTTTTTTTTDAFVAYACDPGVHTLTTAVLDSSDMSAWVHYDLDAGTEVSEGDASWDIRMQTWFVETNGGVTGDGGVMVAEMVDYYDAFDDHCQAPPSSYFIEDTFSGQAFGSWYDYDPSTHELSAGDRIFYVVTTEGAVHRLRFDGYYEGAGGAVHTPGFQHGPVESN